MHRWMLAIILGLVLAGCGLKADEPSHVLLAESITTCSRSPGGQLVAIGGARFFDMQTRAVVAYPLPIPVEHSTGIWLRQDLLLYVPTTPEAADHPSPDNGFAVKPGGLLLDAATGVVTDVSTLPQAAQDQLRIDAAAAFQEEYEAQPPRLALAPNMKYVSGEGVIYANDGRTVEDPGPLVKSTIRGLMHCHRPWEPDSSGIIFVEERNHVLGFETSPGGLRFLPVP